MKNHDAGRRVEGERLVYYNKTADQGFWEEVWLNDLTDSFYKPFREGKLFTFEKIFKRHLPKRGLILEAGCGTAQLVVALNALGYNCLGLDYAVKTLRAAQQLAGPLRLMSGDLTSLGFRDNAFDAIVSIGVVEHRREGLEPFLDEKMRILKPGGVLLISVPYFNPLRLWRAKRGAYAADVSGLDFYQYAYGRREFIQFLENAGFDIEASYSYAHQDALVQELRWLDSAPEPLKKLILRVSKYVPYVNSQLGHMFMAVTRKRA
ncbi:MAG: class I SAM-dependent methyltransferase [Anaerolineales bacterium]|nr:class I SAM-dependent methyltransferase [Anaerolineales bacterium]